jgi:hypothetical protein
MAGVRKSARGLKPVRVALSVILGAATFAVVAPVQVAGATGIGACGSTGLHAASAGIDTCTYTTVGEDSFTVPAGVTSIHVVATGGAGGTASDGGTPGGRAAVVSGDLAVASGPLYVEVGGLGGDTGGFNGGGSGATGGFGSFLSGGGGGASDVRTVANSAPNSLPSRLIVAAGGGGGGIYQEQRNPACPGGSGGDAGQPGGDGANCGAGTAVGGGAGTATTGGAGGAGVCFAALSLDGTSGALGQGGTDNLDVPFFGPSGNGGGGGGGLYGGGGGGGTCMFDAGAAGGGGGSNLVPADGTSALASDPPSVTISYVVTDGTAPTDAPVVTGTAGSNGWYTSDVSVAWNWTDEVGGSGIDTANCTQSSGSGGAEGAAVVVSSSCRDLAGNPASDSRTFQIDKAAPSTGFAISPTSPNGSNGWYKGTAPTVTLTPADGTSGVASTSYAINSGSTHTYTVPFTLPNGSSDVVTYRSTDNAGNVEATKTSATYKVDTTPPTVSVTGVTATQYLAGAVPVAGCASSDPGGSGIATAASVTVTTTGSNGVGSFTARCTGAVDNAGNAQAAPVSVTYTVVYGFGGFMSPLPKSTLAKSGSAIPVKFMLTNSSGMPISANTASALAAAGKVEATLAGPGISPQAVLCSWSGSYFQCNIKTPTGLKTGTGNPYTITAAENVGTGFVTATPVGTAVNPETVYFK